MKGFLGCDLFISKKNKITEAYIWLDMEEEQSKYIYVRIINCNLL